MASIRAKSRRSAETGSDHLPSAVPVVAAALGLAGITLGLAYRKRQAQRAASRDA